MSTYDWEEEQRLRDLKYMTPINMGLIRKLAERAELQAPLGEATTPLRCIRDLIQDLFDACSRPAVDVGLAPAEPAKDASWEDRQEWREYKDKKTAARRHVLYANRLEKQIANARRLLAEPVKVAQLTERKVTKPAKKKVAKAVKKGR
jgi:hypothetical protein